MPRRIVPKLISSAAIMLAALIASPPAAAQNDDVAYGTGFGDANDWTLGGLWDCDDFPGQSAGGNSINFNNAAGSFSGTVSGTARSPVIDAGVGLWLHLHFACRYQTDTTGTATDQRWLRIINAATGATLYQGQFAGVGGDITCTSFNNFHSHTIYLDEFTQQVTDRYLQFEFTFDSVDANGNTGAGWFIDSFIVHCTDVAPPDAIDDLAVTLLGGASARLTWTSPWDRLQELKPGATFDLRYSTTPITDQNWNYVTTHAVGEPNGGVPGTPHTIDVSDLPSGLNYYFAIRTTDIAGNVSPLSNIATAGGAPVPTPPPLSTGSGGGHDSGGTWKPECSAGTAARPDGLVLLGALALIAAASRAFKVH